MKASEKKKIIKPKGGKCSQCKHLGLEFFNDGTGKCPNCGYAFLWNNELALMHKPSGGVCSQCKHHKVKFYDDGHGRCPNCGYSFPWRRDLREKGEKEEAEKATVAPPASPPPPPVPAVPPPAPSSQPQAHAPPQPAPMTQPSPTIGGQPETHGTSEDTDQRKVLEKGHSHLIYEEMPDRVFSMFKLLVTEEKIPAIIISTIFPAKIRKNYNFEEMDIIWLTETSVEGERIMKPKRLDFEISKTLIEFMREEKDCAILLEGLEYLIMENSFQTILKFIKKMNDLASAYGATVVMPVNPRTTSEKELNMLKREFDRGW
jgi:uncharacterized Zn finger protein (UPF0148 family)